MEQGVRDKSVSERYFTNYYTSYVKYDPELDEYHLEVPSTALFHLGWEEGDDIEFVIDERTKNVIVSKKEKKDV
jgi:bifunctional DNA-binding transcriptional regulator/antitoxin component of YhaV-PrlF toxin-antitoxin module